MITFFRTHGLSVLLAACIGLPVLGAGSALAEQEIVLEVGETKTVSVWEPEVVDITVADDKSSIEISGLQAGESPLRVGTVDCIVRVTAAPGGELEESAPTTDRELK